MSLHRIVGVWSLVFNLFISITGTYIAFTIVQGAFPSGGKPEIQSPSVSISIDAALKKVEREFPAFDINYLLFPKSADGKLTILGRFESDPAFYGFNYSNIQINTTTGEIASTRFLRNLPWYARTVTILKPLHFGDYGGLGLKIVYCFFGIFPGILAISGFFIWRLRPAKRPHSPHSSPSKPRVGHSVA
ncbi:PepSY-associated TM helix domain-containing protein [Nafulsella turpanensis]|uniref:PepSY-associated TM helix domain-containing protein n=1 Tax=Nafulsella turpanensis TaxID=1265690 RepID=UPI00047697DC|nr:PepSY-associated TM helix domain-containing protein [Nafulsella turpanensis]